MAAEERLRDIVDIHQRYEGRCTECVEYCDCPTVDVCTHGNVEWPCRTAVAGGFADRPETALI